MKRLAVLLTLVVCVSAQKRPLNHKDPDSWRSIQRPTLSRDGRFLAYGLFPQEGDGEFVVRDLKSGQERREPAGALPPPPDQSVDREPGDEPPAPGIRIAFTSDGKHVVFSTFPSKADSDAAKKARKEAPKNGIGILDLTATGAALRIADVKGFQVPEKGDGFIAYHKEAARPSTDAPKPDPAKPAAGAARGRGSRPTYGTELVLRDLRQSTDRSFPDVLEYSLSKDAKTLVYAVGSRTDENNGVYTVATGTAAAPQALLAGKGKYQKLTWDLKQTRVAFLSDRESTRRLHLWERGAATPEEIVTPQTAGLRSGYVLSDRGQIAFSRDGSRLFFGTGPAVPERDENATPSDDAVVADLWHYKDPYIQPMQKVRANTERYRSYRGVWHVAAKKFVQLADDSLAGISTSDDGRYAIGTDDRAFRSMVDYDRLYMDYYVIDTVAGTRKKIIEKGDAGFGGGPSVTWSPDGERVLFFRNRNWHVITAATGDIVNLTGSLPVSFWNEETDTPSEPGSYGSAGWTRDSASVLVYDRFDVWQISPDGKAKRNLTDGLGRKEKTQVRVVRLERDDEDEPRGIDPKEPLLLRAENTLTRETAIWRDTLNADAPAVRLVSGPRNYRPLSKAKDADVVLMTASTFADFPDLQVTDSTFKTARKVTNANPQKAQLSWGTGELVSFRNADGVPLQAALYKPEGFDPKKKYPMLVYIYEKLSQGVHNFVDPRPGTSPNIAYYVSNGYLVLTPDIVYSVGHPGQSALKCVLPAIDAVVEKGGVDENAIGIAGHSWGGYQIAYMVTQTKRFKAAEAGAPVGNMTSAYNGIRWGSGLPRQFQYERTQSRIGASLWDRPLEFVENSPVFHVRNVTTPVLMVHNDQDDAVPWYQGIELYLSLRRNGKEAYLVNYNGEKHGIRKRPNQKDWTVRIQQFFDHHLKGAPKPAWMEKGIPYIEREKAFPISTDTP